MKERYTPWENWTEEYELQTEKLYKKWLTAHIGEEWEFVWGEVGAAFDRKGGRTRYVGQLYLICIKYKKKCNFSKK